MPASERTALFNFSKTGVLFEPHHHQTMLREAAVANSIADAEKRVDAMQVLCEILTGQVKGERQQLARIKAALASPVPGHEAGSQGAPGDISPEMLAG